MPRRGVVRPSLPRTVCVLGIPTRELSQSLHPAHHEGGLQSHTLESRPDRHRVLPDRWYAVKRQQLGRQASSKAKQSQQLTYLEREREVLLLLARESRGKSDINLFVQLITYGQDVSRRRIPSRDLS